MAATRKPTPAAAPKKPDTANEPTDLRVLKRGSAKTVLGRSTLTYQIGADANNVPHVRLRKNTGGGFLNANWALLQDLYRALGNGGPITAVRRAPIYRGMSSNSPSFLLTALPRTL